MIDAAENQEVLLASLLKIARDIHANKDPAKLPGEGRAERGRIP